MARWVWVMSRDKGCPSCGSTRIEPTVVSDGALVYPGTLYRQFLDGKTSLSINDAERTEICELTCLVCGEMWNVDPDGELVEIHRLLVRSG